MPDHSADSTETQRLLMRIGSGDRNAFNELFDRHRNDLRRAVQLRLDRQLRTRVDASDCGARGTVGGVPPPGRLPPAPANALSPLAAQNGSRANLQSPPCAPANGPTLRPSRNSPFPISRR